MKLGIYNCKSTILSWAEKVILLFINRSFLIKLVDPVLYNLIKTAFLDQGESEA